MNPDCLHSTAPRILVIDDDLYYRTAARRQLTLAGYRVDVAGDLDHALGFLQGSSYDAILLDMHLPDGMGLDLLKARPAHQLNVPVLVITGEPTLETAVGAMRLAVVDYLQKPVRSLPDRVRQAREKAAERADSAELQGLRKEWGRWLDEVSMDLDRLRQALSTGSASMPSPPTPSGHAAAPSVDLSALSERELEVLEEIKAGRPPKEIAKALHISTHTVRNHLKSIYRKLDVHSQVELLALLNG